MTNATLEQMQEIEQAADEVLAGYKSQIQELREQAASNLKQLGQSYDEEKERLVTELKERSERELAVLTQDLEQTRQENEEKAQAALSNKKEVLLQMIVDRVVWPLVKCRSCRCYCQKICWMMSSPICKISSRLKFKTCRQKKLGRELSSKSWCGILISLSRNIFKL